MKRVKLYALNVEDVVVSGDFVEVSNFNRDEVIKVRNSDEFVFNKTKVQYSKIPIEKYYNHCGISGIDNEYLVAFDPEIKNILQIREKDLEREICEIKRESENSLKRLNEIHNSIRLEQVREITSFKTMSFWNRLKFLFIGSKIKLKKVSYEVS